jgi:hypothetical protein
LGLTPPPDYLYLIENLVFKDQAIQLDGYRFKNCAFVNCTLHVQSGNFRIEECFIQGNWWANLSGDAARVAKLTTSLDQDSIGPALRSVIHPNGGISIV